MAVIAAQVFDTGQERVAVWPNLTDGDTGAPVDFSRFSSVVVSGTGLWDDETLAMEANNILSTTPAYGAMVDTNGADAELTDDGFLDLGKWNNHFLRPNIAAGDSTTTAVTVVAVGTQ